MDLVKFSVRRNRLNLYSSEPLFFANSLLFTFIIPLSATIACHLMGIVRRFVYSLRREVGRHDAMTNLRIFLFFLHVLHHLQFCCEQIPLSKIIATAFPQKLCGCCLFTNV